MSEGQEVVERVRNMILERAVEYERVHDMWTAMFVGLVIAGVLSLWL